MLFHMYAFNIYVSILIAIIYENIQVSLKNVNDCLLKFRVKAVDQSQPHTSSHDKISNNNYSANGNSPTIKHCNLTRKRGEKEEQTIKDEVTGG